MPTLSRVADVNWVLGRVGQISMKVQNLMDNFNLIAQVVDFRQNLAKYLTGIELVALLVLQLLCSIL